MFEFNIRFLFQPLTDILAQRNGQLDKVLLLKLEELRKEQDEILQIVEEIQEIIYNVLRLSQ